MASAPIIFHEGVFTFPKPVAISEVLALDFTINFKRSSSLTLVCKNTAPKLNLYLFTLLHCVAALVIVPALIYLADYIILTEIVLCLSVAYIVIPKYLAAWRNLNKDGVIVVPYDDPADIVQVQKAVFADQRGKKLIKRGLIESKFVEQVCYCFMPNQWFNSDIFRDWVKFLGEVVYPILVIVCPLVLTVLYLIGPVISQLQAWVKKDYFIRLVIKTAECISEEAEDHMGRYWFTRLLFRYYEFVYGWYFYVLYFLMGWLQTEVALFLMKIDYMQDRYMRVFKTIKQCYNTARKLVVGFLKVVFFPAVQMYERTLGRYKKVVETAKPGVLLDAFEKTKKLNEEVSKVANIAKEVVPELHAKAE